MSDTPLARLLKQQIAATGPMTVADYMATCLLHPTLGYYATRDPFGMAGDFTTAPEISQMFGEVLGLMLAQAWADRGQAAAAVLAEPGPGRGTLMADMLRVAARVPGFRPEVHLVEASAHLRDVQRRTLAGHAVTWHDRIADLPEAPLFLIANEFFDALPVRQFLRAGSGWRERCIGLVDGRLAFGLSDPTDPPDLAHRRADTGEGEMVELCPAAGPLIADLVGRIARQGGVAVIIDYGGWGSCGDTLQAVRGHAFADPLAEPGLADLTAHVDFAALARAAGAVPGIVATPLTPQGALLERLGIGARAEALATVLHGEKRAAHLAAYRRLTHPDEMGNLFQTVAFYRRGDPAPPGFGP